jgi:hypothetical protein
MDYFPTQFLTRQSSPSNENGLNIYDGNTYYQNVSISEDMAIAPLIKDYPVENHRVSEGPFNLKDNLKWSPMEGEVDWRPPFMRHLRKLVILTAARQNARVEHVKFSFPKALSFEDQQFFKSMILGVWKQFVNRASSFMSESEAARKWLLTESQNEYVVLDIGGGTTDILAIHSTRALFQSSFKISGGQINDYVIKSKAFRSRLISVCRKIPGIAAEMTPFENLLDRVGVDNRLIKMGWFGLLQVLTEGYEEELLGGLRRSLPADARAQARATRGFFLTVTVMIAGLCYLAGRLLRAQLDREGLQLHRVNLVLLGNGSKFFQMISPADAPLNHAAQRWFSAGLEYGASPDETNQYGIVFRGVPEIHGRPRPKEIVALGILKGDQDAVQPVPVGSLPEDGSYYEKVPDSLERHQQLRGVPPDFAHFLREFEKQLPRGKNGPFEVIPFANVAEGDGSSIAVELEKVFCSSACLAYVREREFVNAARFKKAVAESSGGNADLLDEAKATEPLFATRVAGLLEGILDTYGKN